MSHAAHADTGSFTKPGFPALHSKIFDWMDIIGITRPHGEKACKSLADLTCDLKVYIYIYINLFNVRFDLLNGSIQTKSGG